jgi:DNA-binding NtrC family response regulator
MTMPSAASTVGMPWNRGLSAFESDDKLPPPMGAQFPPRRPPAGLAADALPRARVLVVEREAIVALDLQRTLREAGYRAIGPAATLGEVQRLIEQGPIDCALIDVDANRGTTLPISDLLAFADVPFVFVMQGDNACIPQRHADRPRVRKPDDPAALVAAIERAMRKRSRAAANDNANRPVTPQAAWPRIFPQL